VKELQPLRKFGVPELLKLKTSRANLILENRRVFACHRDAAEQSERRNGDATQYLTLRPNAETGQVLKGAIQKDRALLAYFLLLGLVSAASR
jgi:hypothetical protein